MCMEHLPKHPARPPRLLMLVFIACLRGAYPCTINPVSHQQTWLCLLFCAGSLQTSLCAVAFSVFILPLDTSETQMFRYFPSVVVLSGYIMST